MNGVAALRLRDKRKRQGLCIRCGREKDKKQYYCQKCQEVNAAYKVSLIFSLQQK